jgi:hypothetical protein
MPLPFIFLAGAAKAAVHATATLATKLAVGTAKGAAVKGAAVKGSAGKGSSAVRLPPGTTTVAKKLVERLGDDDTDDDGKKEKR